MLKFQRQMEIFISDVENLLKKKKKKKSVEMLRGDPKLLIMMQYLIWNS